MNVTSFICLPYSSKSYNFKQIFVITSMNVNLLQFDDIAISNSTSPLQWNLSITDTLGPDIFGHFLLQYRGFPLSEIKNVLVIPVRTKILSLTWRFSLLGP